jgi:DNA (cytosine-5)-methyltransferase 1
MRYISLFSGVGGFEKGIMDYDPSAECVGFSEIDSSAIGVYKHHYPHHNNLGDIRNIIGSDHKDIDLMCGGFPCQDVSHMSKHRAGITGTRSGLISEVFRLVGEAKPKYILLENVKGVLKYQEYIIGELNKCGYRVKVDILSGFNVGVPQSRPRVFFKGVRKDIATLDNIPLSATTQTLSCILDRTYNHLPIKHKYYTELINQCRSFNHSTGLNQRNEASPFLFIQSNKPVRCAWFGPSPPYANNRVYSTGGICPTITTGGNILIYDGEADIIRRLTPLELERCQGLPDNWTRADGSTYINSLAISVGAKEEVVGNPLSNAKRCKMIGNSVIPKVVERCISGMLSEVV